MELNVLLQWNVSRNRAIEELRDYVRRFRVPRCIHPCIVELTQDHLYHWEQHERTIQIQAATS
jgi:hypothetical protein